MPQIDRPTASRATGLHGHKPLVMAVVGLWFGLLAGLYAFVRPELAYSYGHWTAGLGGHLPLPTQVLSLPVLGSAFGAEQQGHAALFWLVWGLLLAPPIVLLRQTWRAREPQALLGVLLWQAVHMLLAAIVMVAVAFGLWLPFSAA